jgi:hypothetical protein
VCCGLLHRKGLHWVGRGGSAAGGCSALRTADEQALPSGVPQVYLKASKLGLNSLLGTRASRRWECFDWHSRLLHLHLLSPDV